MCSDDASGFDWSLVDPQLLGSQVLDRSNYGVDVSAQRINPHLNHDPQINTPSASLPTAEMMRSPGFDHYELDASKRELNPSAQPLDGTPGVPRDMKTGDTNLSKTSDSVHDELWDRWFAMSDPYPIHGISGCLSESSTSSNCLTTSDSSLLLIQDSRPIDNKAPRREDKARLKARPISEIHQPRVVVSQRSTNFQSIGGSQPATQAQHFNPSSAALPSSTATLVPGAAKAPNAPPVRYSTRERQTFEQMHHAGETNEAIAATLNRSENAISIRRNRIWGKYKSAHASDAARAQHGPTRAPRVRRQASEDSTME